MKHREEWCRWVNAETGERVVDKAEDESKGIKVISRSTYRGRKLVNAQTGEEVLDKTDAEKQGIEIIPRSTYRARTLVNAQTGEKIIDKVAAEKEGIKMITQTAYYGRKWVNAQSGEVIINKVSAEQQGIKVVRKRVFEHRQLVNAKTGEKIIDKAEAEKQGIDVTTKSAYRTRKLVNIQKGRIKDKDQEKKDSINLTYNNTFSWMKQNKKHRINEKNLQKSSVTEFCIKSEKEISNTPSLGLISFDELDKAISILRGSSSSQDNCVHLALDILKFIQTREIPSQKSNETSSTFEVFKTIFTSKVIAVPIKNEKDSIIKKRKITQITESVASRSTLFFMQLPIVYQQQPYALSEEKYDLTKPFIIDLEEFHQTRLHYREVVAYLKNNANQEKSKEYYGVINFGFSGSKSPDYGHMITFYATPCQVFFIDGHFIMNGEYEKQPVFEDLATHYDFADTKTVSKNKSVFGCDVFIIPVMNNLLRHDSNVVTPTS